MTGLPPIVTTARKLRREMSLPEVLLWQQLRLRPGGVKFRRQHAIGHYVVDFFCAAAKLAVEVDGRTHDGVTAEGDARCDVWLAAEGIRCVRIAAPRVLADPAGVAIWLAAQGGCPVAPPHHQRKSDGPPPRAGEDQGQVTCR